MKNIETLDLTGALQHAISLVVQHKPQHVLFLTSTHVRSKFVWTGFEELINTVPAWLIPKVISMREHTLVFETGTVVRISSGYNSLRGLTIHQAIIDDAFKEDKDALMYILPTLVREPNSTAYWVKV